MEFKKEQNLFQKILLKAWEDKIFKKELVANPLKAIKGLVGEEINLPEGKTLVVSDQSDEDVIYLNIPAQVDLDDVELNDEQLDIVSGGEDELPIIVDPNDDPLGGITVGGTNDPDA